jgi:hypothetical protein
MKDWVNLRFFFLARLLHECDYMQAGPQGLQAWGREVVLEQGKKRLRGRGKQEKETNLEISFIPARQPMRMGSYRTRFRAGKGLLNRLRIWAWSASWIEQNSAVF